MNLQLVSSFPADLLLQGSLRLGIWISGYLTIEVCEQRPLLYEAAQPEVDEASSGHVSAGLDQDVFHLDVPMEDVVLLKLERRIYQLLQDDLRGKHDVRHCGEVLRR